MSSLPASSILGDRRRRVSGGIGVGGFLLALATAGALLHVAVRMKGIEVAYALGKERKLNKELEEERRRLHIEIGMLKDPDRIVELARDKLHMGPPAPGDILRGPPPAASGASPVRVSVTIAPRGGR